MFLQQSGHVEVKLHMTYIFLSAPWNGTSLLTTPLWYALPAYSIGDFLLVYHEHFPPTDHTPSTPLHVTTIAHFPQIMSQWHSHRIPMCESIKDITYNVDCRWWSDRPCGGHTCFLLGKRVKGFLPRVMVSRKEDQTQEGQAGETSDTVW